MDLSSFLQHHKVPHIVVAKYTRQNSFLLGALGERDVKSDPYIIHEFGPATLYFEHLRDDNEEEYAKLVEATGSDDPDDSDLFDAVISGNYTPTPGAVEQFLKVTPEHRLLDAIREYEGEGQSMLNFTLNNKSKLLPRQTWVGHFCSDATDIATEGFIFGASDPYDLGLTTHKSDSYRRSRPGYNFGFELGSLHKNFNDGNSRNSGKYGSELVLFQTSGVSAYHQGDNEDQVIFWGPDVDWVIPIVPAEDNGNDNHSEDDYAVLAKDGSVAFRTYCEVSKSKTAGNYARHNIEACAAWVLKTFNQNHSRICWELPKVK